MAHVPSFVLSVVFLCSPKLPITELKKAIQADDKETLETLLEQARQKRERLIAYKLEQKELF